MDNEFFIDSEHLSQKALEKSTGLKMIRHQEKIIWNICREWSRLNQIFAKK